MEERHISYSYRDPSGCMGWIGDTKIEGSYYTIYWKLRHKSRLEDGVIFKYKDELKFYDQTGDIILCMNYREDEEHENGIGCNFLERNDCPDDDAFKQELFKMLKATAKVSFRGLRAIKKDFKDFIATHPRKTYKTED